MNHLQLYSKAATELLHQAVLSSCQTVDERPSAEQDVIGIRGRKYSDDSPCPNPNPNPNLTTAPNNVEKQRINLSQTTIHSHEAPLMNKSRQDLMNQMGSPPTSEMIIDTEMDNSDEGTIVTTLEIPTTILPPVPSEDEFDHYQDATSQNSAIQPLISLHQLSNKLSSGNHYTLVILLQSGRFAAALFSQQRCVKHTTSQRYTVRKGQGGSQSSNDQSKGKAKSIGSQLRRAGEAQLRQDVYEGLSQWKNLIENNVSLCFVSISKMLLKGFWEDVAKIFIGNGSNSNNTDEFVLRKENVKHIPLDVGRPCHDACCAAYEIMMKCTVQSFSLKSVAMEEEQEERRKDMHSKESDEMKTKEPTNEKTKKSPAHYLPLTPLHEAARDADYHKIIDILDTNGEDAYDIDLRAGPKLMTPLHYCCASSSSNTDGSPADPADIAKCVQTLLLEGHANPSLHDLHDRPPYYVTEHEVVRTAFRRARAELGEDTWDWEQGRVGPPVSESDIKLKKEKAAEKKRRQRQRQKERKAQEKIKAAAEEQRMKDEAEQKKMEENAVRQRAGLKAKSSNDNACDYCNQVCKGKRKSQMFSRLSFHYCSIECVNKHKRELAAKAAESRFGGS